MTLVSKLKGHASRLALLTVLAAPSAYAQSTVDMPVLPNSEPETGPIANDSGFVLSLDGAPVDADPQVEDRVRQTDVALANADVKIQLDTLDPTPRLDVEIVGPARSAQSVGQVTLQSETNYPAFIARGEMRIIDRNAVGGDRLVMTVPVNPNGQATLVLPQGRDLVAVHRVYDARGRYDETEALLLFQADDRGQVDNVEEGNQFTATRGIRVTGATVTVSATNIVQGAVLQTLGETVRPDANGRLVVERILPAGDYVVDVAVTGGGQNLGLTRPIDIPGSEWFYVAVADLTYGRYSDGQAGETFDRATGRLQYYVDGSTDKGLRVTSSLDTGEEELSEIFSRLDGKNPRDIIDRIDPNEGYATYGDDSTSEDNTPTSGKFYLRVEQDNSFFVWGDYQAQVAGNTLLRNERSLYGAQAHLETLTTTDRGDARATLDLYAAQPDQLVGRDVFRGTGGSVYFLRRQDVSLGTETITVELRDRATGRVVDRQQLVEGRDYQINHVQGIITLTSPLTGSADRRLISTNPSGDETVTLIAQYEYTPTSGDVDGFSYGGRVEGWVTDDLRLGITGMLDDTGVTDQRAVGADLRYEIGENSHIQLDYAETDGPGFDTSLSDDGGLVFGTNASTGGTGSSTSLEVKLDLGDLGSDRDGAVGGYYQERTVGFATLDYEVTDATGDETLFGIFANVEKGEGRFGFGVYADSYENSVGDERLEYGAEVSAQITDRVSLDAGVERLEEQSATDNGDRTDVALRLTYAVREELDIYAFGQTTVDSTGLDDNDRYGVGLNGKFFDNWVIGAEIYDGRGGVGGRILATQTREDNSSTYFGYELDQGRALDAGVAAEDNGGRYVVGGRRHINDQVSVFGENTYDLFGSAQELIGAYGVTYKPSQFLSYTVSYDMGQVSDDVNGDIDRQALSFGVRYEDETLRAAARAEWRRDNYEDPAEDDTDAFFYVADADYRISEETRLVFSADVARTEANGVSFQSGRLVDASIGYAHRPISNERLNVLASYRYFYDDVGQEVDGQSEPGPVQESHVVSLEGNYDLDEQWTLGAKVAGRWTDSAPVAGDPLVSNDAWLAVANVRYHVVHNWDVLLEARHLNLTDAGSTQSSVLGAAYRHVGNNAKIGVGYNFGNFSSDLADLTFDDEGVFVNLIAKF